MFDYVLPSDHQTPRFSVPVKLRVQRHGSKRETGITDGDRPRPDSQRRIVSIAWRQVQNPREPPQVNARDNVPEAEESMLIKDLH